MNVSPGCISARNTAWFAWLPEFGCTLANLQLEQLAGALDRQRLGDVDELAAAVVAPARIALGVFVGHHRALRLEHGARDDVLRGDQLDLVALATELQLDRAGDFRVRVAEGRGEEGIRADGLRDGLVHDGPLTELRRRAAHSTKGKGTEAAARRFPRDAYCTPSEHNLTSFA